MHIFYFYFYFYFYLVLDPLDNAVEDAILDVFKQSFSLLLNINWLSIFYKLSIREGNCLILV